MDLDDNDADEIRKKHDEEVREGQEYLAKLKQQQADDEAKLAKDEMQKGKDVVERMKDFLTKGDANARIKEDDDAESREEIHKIVKEDR